MHIRYALIHYTHKYIIDTNKLNVTYKKENHSLYGRI